MLAGLADFGRCWLTPTPSLPPTTYPFPPANACPPILKRSRLSRPFSPFLRRHSSLLGAVGPAGGVEEGEDLLLVLLPHDVFPQQRVLRGHVMAKQEGRGGGVRGRGIF